MIEMHFMFKVALKNLITEEFSIKINEDIETILKVHLLLFIISSKKPSSLCPIIDIFFTSKIINYNSCKIKLIII